MLSLATFNTLMGRDSSVGIVTRYRLGSPGIESQSGWYFPHPSWPAVGPTQSSTQWGPGPFSQRESGRDMLTSHPPICSAEVKERVELHIYAFMAYYRVNLTLMYLYQLCYELHNPRVSVQLPSETRRFSPLKVSILARGLPQFYSHCATGLFPINKAVGALSCTFTFLYCLS